MVKRVLFRKYPWLPTFLECVSKLDFLSYHIIALRKAKALEREW